MKPLEVKAELHRLVREFATSGFPDRDVQIVDEYIEVGEAGVAFEHICTQMLEYDLAITDLQRAALSKLGTAMKLEPRYWNRLRATSATVLSCEACAGAACAAGSGDGCRGPAPPGSGCLCSQRGRERCAPTALLRVSATRW